MIKNTWLECELFNGDGANIPLPAVPTAVKADGAPAEKLCDNSAEKGG